MYTAVSVDLHFCAYVETTPATRKISSTEKVLNSVDNIWWQYYKNERKHLCLILMEKNLSLEWAELDTVENERTISISFFIFSFW